VSEVVLPRRVLPQPVPFINQGGDCSACVLGGLLGLPSVEATYEQYGRELSNWWGFRTALWTASTRGHVDRILDDPPIWLPHTPAFQTFGLPGHMNNLAWFNYVRMGLEAGYYGCAGVSFHKSGPLGDGADHKILIVGARELREPSRQEILVSCSARSTPDEEWVEVRDFLRHRGGHNVVLVRPAPEPA
jgi:hypothetical protein